MSQKVSRKKNQNILAKTADLLMIQFSRIPMNTPPPVPSVTAIQYKVVPFAAAVAFNQNASHLATQLETLITENASSGWEYVGFHQIQTFKTGTGGCFGSSFGSVAPTTITMEFVVFRK